MGRLNRKTLIADIRECEEHNGGCDQICLNKEGIVNRGYECDCDEGFILGRDGHSCIGMLFTLEEQQGQLSILIELSVIQFS